MFLPEIYAVSAAFCFALSSMFLSELKGRVPLLQMARWQMFAAFAMTGAGSLLLGGWRSLDLWQVAALAASSLVGITLASSTYFATIYAVGPRITALLFSLTSPFAVGLGYVFLGETVTPQQGFGIALVLAGIVLAIGVPGLGGPKSGAAVPWMGIVLGVITAVGQAGGTLLARPAMASGAEPFTAMALRSGLAALVFVLISATPVGKSSRIPVQRDALAVALVSAFIGTGLGMVLMMQALAGGNAGIVATLTSMTPVLILPMVWFRSGHRPSAMAWLGALLAIGGTALISIR